MTLGPFPNEDNRGIEKEFIPTAVLSMEPVENIYGDRTTWNVMRQIFVRTNLNDYYGHFGENPPGNPERVCAYAVTTLIAPEEENGYLEIAGTDVVRIWLNGIPITTGPLKLSEKPQRRRIELRRGDNPLLVQSCEEIGSWYFDVRVTDDDGNDLESVRSAGRLPRKQPPPPPQAADDVSEASLQLVEGFFEVLAFQHSQENYGDYRGGTMSWWAYSDDSDPNIIWQTAAAAAQRRSAVAFTASMGGGPSTGELSVNGERVLSFDISQTLGDRVWKEGEWELRYVYRSPAAGNSGYFLLLAPGSAVGAGESLELRVTIGPSDQKTWFMIKDYNDTASYEHLSGDAILAGKASDWETLDEDPTETP